MATPIYRKIYEHHFGSIPKDHNNISYEIHHKDGNHNNNEISNLQCVSIDEHYNIHKERGDHGACIAISKRMKLTTEQRSILTRQHALKMKDQGKLFFQTERGRAITSKRNRELARQGNHPAQRLEFRTLSRERAIHRNKINNQKPWTCPVCNKTGRGLANYGQHQQKYCR